MYWPFQASICSNLCNRQIIVGGIDRSVLFFGQHKVVQNKLITFNICLIEQFCCTRSQENSERVDTKCTRSNIEWRLFRNSAQPFIFHLTGFFEKSLSERRVVGSPSLLVVGDVVVSSQLRFLPITLTHSFRYYYIIIIIFFSQMFSFLRRETLVFTTANSVAVWRVIGRDAFSNPFFFLLYPSFMNYIALESRTPRLGHFQVHTDIVRVIRQLPVIKFSFLWNLKLLWNLIYFHWLFHILYFLHFMIPNIYWW